MNKLFKIVFWISIATSFLASIWFVLHGTIYFHTDIARDFLLIEDIVLNKKLTLIGPHSGGIEGVFHGPLWLYLNVPAFMLGSGNPVVVGWFWAALTMLSIGIVFFATKKLADSKTAMIASALYGLAIASSAANLINPFGAMLLSPLFFYFFILYLKKSSFIHLLISLFLLGLIIQFQMAWGVPILVLTIPLLFHHFFIHKKISHIFSFGILALPLSSFILFDLRHQFLQTKSVLSYLSHSSTQIHGSIIAFIGGRMQTMFLNLMDIFAQGNIALQLGYFLLLIFIMYYVKIKKGKHSAPLNYFLYFYIGYFVLTLLYKGTMWGYYITPFIPLFCIAVSMAIASTPLRLRSVLFILIALPLLFLNIKNMVLSNSSFKTNTGLWQFYYQQAHTIFKDAGGDFGWYTYSADQYSYSPKYAMHYAQRNSAKKGFSFEKKPTTYLIIFPSTNKYTNAADWKRDKIKLTRKPNKTFPFSDGSYIEKYILTPEEQVVPAAGDLIQDLMFR